MIFGSMRRREDSQVTCALRTARPSRGLPSSRLAGMLSATARSITDSRSGRSVHSFLSASTLSRGCCLSLSFFACTASGCETSRLGKQT